MMTRRGKRGQAWSIDEGWATGRVEWGSREALTPALSQRERGT